MHTLADNTHIHTPYHPRLRKQQGYKTQPHLLKTGRAVPGRLNTTHQLLNQRERQSSKNQCPPTWQTAVNDVSWKRKEPVFAAEVRRKGARGTNDKVHVKLKAGG